jgi:hypothetical protein
VIVPPETCIAVSRYNKLCNVANCKVLWLSKFFYSPTDAQVKCLKNNIKIYIKTAPTCFGTVTPSSGRALFELAKVTVVKIAN